MADDTDQSQTQGDNQPDPVAEELARLRALAQKFQPLENIADALDQDPSKIYALQAALRGDTPQQQPSNPQPNRNLTQEEIQELNARALSNPAEFMAAVAQQAVNNGLARFSQEASPYMTTTADLFIETFKNGKAGQDALYKQIVPVFEKEMRDVNRQALLQASAAERNRQLELRWNSAAAQVFRKAAATQTNAPNLGGGGSSGGASAPQKKQTIFEKDAGVNALTQRLIDQGLLSKEDVEASLAEIEAENE